MGHRNIKVRQETKDSMDDLKLHVRISYDEIIRDLLLGRSPDLIKKIKLKILNHPENTNPATTKLVFSVIDEISAETFKEKAL